MVGHYIPKLREDWQKWSRQVLSDRQDEEVTNPVTSAFLRSAGYIDEVAEMSVCWAISEKAFPMIWNTDLDSGALEGMRLPYPQMAIEYNFDYTIAATNIFKAAGIADPAPNRIIILTELDEDRFAVISAFKAEEKDLRRFTDWAVCPLAVCFHYDSFHNVSSWFKPSPKGRGYDIKFFGDMDNMRDGPILTGALPMYEKEVIGDFSEEEIVSFANDMADEIKVTLGLLSILGCSNAPVEEIIPPAKLNKKRVKSGKAPIPTYRTLHITDHTTREGGGNQTGTHASPRTHMRRGHIRNQPTARGYVRKWIRPTIVMADQGVPPKPEVVIT